MKDIYQSLTGFTQVAQQLGVLDPLDEIYVRNRLLALLHLKDYKKIVPEEEASLLTYMDQMIAYAQEEGLIEGSLYKRERLEAAIMDLLTPRPAEVNRKFWALYKDDPKKATDYFYALSQTNDYIKTRSISKNIHFNTHTKHGPLEISINLSKPEKDAAEVLRARDAAVTSYPACVLCMENEGYEGRVNHPARQNHRLIRLNVGERTYGFQYSPYVYYNEHSIFLNEFHIPMVIDEHCFRNLLEIVTQFPHYFVGSNADLPRVGGSILAHDHYQGGRYSFPMEEAKGEEKITFDAYPEVEAEWVAWPMSVIRLRHKSRELLVELASYILKEWRLYSDETCGILASTEDEEHNTLTPIARYKGGVYELDLVLRNNRTSEEHPEGIFHPHRDVHHIKKESIGLIEVMGLAILPPRLEHELKEVKAYLQGERPLEEVTSMHQAWAQSLAQEAGEVDERIRQGLGDKFARVLEDAGVYKQDAAGCAGRKRFIDSLNRTNA